MAVFVNSRCERGIKVLAHLPLDHRVEAMGQGLVSEARWMPCRVGEEAPLDAGRLGDAT